MTPNEIAAFQAGSGIAPETLLTGIASVVLILAIVWVMWVILGTFRAWENQELSLIDLIWSGVRASIVLLVLGVYLR